MKAVLCKKFGPIEDLVLEEVPSPQIRKHHVLVSVKACGVNFPDTLVVEGKYQFKPEFPFSPGTDIAGIVKEIGEGVTQFKVGDRVFSGSSFGGFAEEALIDARQAFPIPEGIDFITAASLLMTYSTSYHALVDRGNLKAGETLLVLGAAGGVGLAAIDIAKQIGAQVIAAASTNDKLEVCKEFGADELINYTQEDLKESIKKITQGRGVDVIYDPVGGQYAEPAFRSMAWEGRFLVVGFATGDIPALPLNLPLLKGASIVGVFMGAFAQRTPQKYLHNLQEILTWFQEGKLHQHIHATYPLDRATEALREIADRKVKGKVVMSI